MSEGALTVGRLRDMLIGLPEHMIVQIFTGETSYCENAEFILACWKKTVVYERKSIPSVTLSDGKMVTNFLEIMEIPEFSLDLVEPQTILLIQRSSDYVRVEEAQLRQPHCHPLDRNPDS